MVDFSNGVNSPGPASYTAPLMDFGVLGNLANTYYQGRENQFAEQQRQRELTLQKPIDSSDPNAVALELMRRGGAGYAQQLLPFLERQQPGQVSPLVGGQPGASPPNATGALAPGGASPAGTTASPQPAPTPSPVPAPMRPQGSPAGDDGVSSVVAVASSRLPEDSQKTGAAIINIAKVLGVDPNQPLSLEQKARAAQLIESYAKRNGIAAPAAAAPAETPVAIGGATQAQPQSAAPDAANAGPILPQGFTDPRKAVTALRNEAARALASGNQNTKGQAPQLTAWADRIEQAVAGPQQFGVIAHDENGQPVYGFINPSAQTVKTPGGLPAPASGNALLTGQPYLDTLDPGRAAQIKAMVEGRMNPPGGMSLKSPQIQGLMRAAAQYEPGFDFTKWQGRAASVKDFASGKSAEMVRSANQTIGHVGDLIGSMDKLNNTFQPQYNRLGNYVNSEVLGKEGVKGFTLNAHAVADELSKVFKGAGISDHEIKTWESGLNANMSPEQQREAVNKIVGLLKSSLAALEDKRIKGMGEVAAEKAGPLLNEHSQEALDRIVRWTAGEKMSAPKAPQSRVVMPAPTSEQKADKDGWVTLQNGARIREIK